MEFRKKRENDAIDAIFEERAVIRLFDNHHVRCLARCVISRNSTGPFSLNSLIILINKFFYLIFHIPTPYDNSCYPKSSTTTSRTHAYPFIPPPPQHPHFHNQTISPNPPPPHFNIRHTLSLSHVSIFFPINPPLSPSPTLSLFYRFSIL